MSDESEKSGKQTEAIAPSVKRSGWLIVNFDVLTNPSTGLAASVYVAAGLFALAVLVLAGFGLYAAFNIAYESSVGDFKNRIEAAKVFFPILLALVGGPLLIWRVITAHIQAQAARDQAETGREAHYTALFTKAVEGLGATREVKTIAGRSKDIVPKDETWIDPIITTEPNLEVRLGAIYALDRVARDSERDHWPIMEVLCAYIRSPENSGAPKLLPGGAEPGGDEFREWLSSMVPPRVDLQAALTVIGRRLEGRRELEAGTDLQLDLRKANLQRAFLSKGHFERASFEDANLDGAVCLEAYFSGAGLTGASLCGMSFNNAHLDDVRFDRVQLTGASFHDAQMARVRFNNANLAGASFVHAKLGGASFNSTHLAGAEFNNANLSGASFYQTALADVWFSDADLAGASFEKADLAGALLFHADLSKAKRLDPLGLAHALGDASTKLANGVQRPTTWPDRVLDDDGRRMFIEKARAERRSRA